MGDKLTIGGPRGSLVVPEDYPAAVRVRRVGHARAAPPFRKHRKTACSPGDPRHRHRGRCDVPDYLAHLSGFNITGYWPQRAGGSRPSCSAGRAGRGLLYLADREGVKRLSRQFETDAIDPQLVRASAYWHAK